MSFSACTERSIAAPQQRVFDKLADVASWPAWMPRSFVAVLRKDLEPEGDRATRVRSIETWN
jgi:uncharacterized protein YndB with AHSA1/START domain